MQTIIGYFDPTDIDAAREGLVSGGFRPENIMEIATMDEIPPFLEGEPERKASQGWLAGAILGALLGAVAGWLATFLIQTSFIIMSVLIGAGSGAMLGGYLGSIYSLRADTEVEMHVHEALGHGLKALVVRTADGDAETAATIMQRHRGEHVEVRPIATEAVEFT